MLSGDGNHSRSRVAQTTARGAQCTDGAMNAAVTGLTEAVRTMGQSVTRPRPEDMRVRKPEPYMPGKDFDDWDFTMQMQSCDCARFSTEETER